MAHRSTPPLRALVAGDSARQRRPLTTLYITLSVLLLQVALNLGVIAYHLNQVAWLDEMQTIALSLPAEDAILLTVWFGLLSVGQLASIVWLGLQINRAWGALMVLQVLQLTALLQIYFFRTGAPLHRSPALYAMLLLAAALVALLNTREVRQLFTSRRPPYVPVIHHE